MKTPRQTAGPVRLEVLEQRILLSAELPVQDSDTWLQQTQAVDTAVSPTHEDPLSPSSDWDPAASTKPLQMLSPAGALSDLLTPTASGQMLTLAPGYTLMGAGQWNGPLHNTGTVNPGESPGILSVQTYEQASSGVLRLEIGGQSAGVGYGNPLEGHDQVAVAGQAILAGTLSLDFINDFRPTAGQVFDVMTWSSRQGSFSAYTGLYAGNGIYLKPVYEANRLRLVATAMPGLDQLSVAGMPQSQQALDGWLTQLANGLSQAAVTLDASLDIAGMRLSGQWQVAVAPLPGNQVESTWTAMDAGAQWSMPGLQGALSQVKGSLVMGPDGLRMNLQGQGALSVPGGPAASGLFSLIYQQSDGQLAVSAQDVAMQLGDPARGPALALSSGSLMLLTGGGRYSLLVTGNGEVQALPEVSLQGQLRYVAATGEVARFEAQNAALSMGALGTLSGDLSFASRSLTADGQTQQTLVLGALVSSARLNLDNLALQVSQGRLGLVWGSTTPTTGLGTASSHLALSGWLDLSVALGDAVSLSGQAVRVAYNPGTNALRHDMVLADGSALLMDLAAHTTQVSGRFAAEIQGVLRFEGDLSLDATAIVRLLSNGQTVALTEYALSGARVALAFAPDGAGGALVAREGEMAMVYARDAAGNSWITGRGAAGALVLGGYVLEDLQSAQWSINRAVQLQPELQGVTLDWSDTRRFDLASGRQFLLDQVGEVLSAPVQGTLVLGDNRLSGLLQANYNRITGEWSLSATDAHWWLAAGPAFVRLSQVNAQLRIDSQRKRTGEISGQVEVGGIAGLQLSASSARVSFNDLAGAYNVSLSGARVVVAGFGEISGDLSISRQDSATGERLLIAGVGLMATVGPAGAQVRLANADMALVLARDALGQAGYALVAQGAVSLETLEPGFDLSAPQARIEINRLGSAIDETLTVGEGRTVQLSFEDERARSAVSISGASLQLGEWGSLSGDLRIDSRQVTVGAITRQQLEIGVDKLEASLALGGPNVSLSGGRAGLLMFSETVAGQPTLRYALQAEAQAVLSGVSGLSLSAQRLQVSINRSGAAIERTMATPDGGLQLSLMDGETRLSGHAAVAVGNWFSAEGEVFLESRQNQTVTLSDNSTANVNMLLLGGSGLSASLNLGSTLALGDVSLALALSSEIGGAARRWITSTATVGSASLDAVAQAQIDLAMLDLNRQLASDGSLYLYNDETVINWRPNETNPGLPLVLSDTQALVLDSDQSRLALAVQGRIDIGGARVEGIFHLAESALEVNGQQQPAWALVVSQAKVALTANGARAQIENVVGHLLIAADGVSGTLSGDGSVTGIDDLSASGRLVAGFSEGRLQLAGTLEMALAGVGQLTGHFSVIKEPAMVSLPVFQSLSASTGGGGEVFETVAGGLISTAKLRLSLSDANGQFTREGLYGLSWGGQTQTFNTLDGSGADARPVSDALLADRIRAAFERLSAVGLGNVSVSGMRTTGFEIEFIGALAGQPVTLATAADQSGLWLTQPPDPADRDDWGVIEETAAMQAARSEVQELTLSHTGGTGQTFTLSLGDRVTAPIAFNAAGLPLNERQVITLTAANRASGQFWLGLDGQTSPKIRYSADPSQHTSQLRLALEALVGVGNVTVRYEEAYTGHNSIDYIVEFRGALAGRDVSSLQAFSSAGDIVLQVQTLRQGSAGYSVSQQAKAIESALQATLGAGNVSVAYNTASSASLARFQITFDGGLAGQDLSPLAVNVSGSGVSGSVNTLRDGRVASGAVQNIRLYDEAVLGTFELSLVFEGETFTTNALAFNASALQVQSALLSAQNTQGRSLAQLEVQAQVQLLPDTRGSQVWQVKFGGRAADAVLDVMQGRITSAVPAPDARLSLERQASTSSETQRLNLGNDGRLLRLSLQGSSGSTELLNTATLTPEALRHALAGLAGIGAADNVQVTAASEGVYDLAFTGALAGRNLAPLLVIPVQTLSLAMAGGQRPTHLEVMFEGSAQSTPEFDMVGLSDEQLAQSLQLLIGMLPDLNAGQVRVQARADAPLTFDISFVNALAGASLPALQAVVSRSVEVASERLLIGASQVSAAIGGAGAGVALAEGDLALMVQKRPDGSSGYALQLSGQAALSGFDGSVSLSAGAQLRVNAMGEAVTVSVPTGTSSSTLLLFEDGSARQELLISNGRIDVAGLGHVQGDLKLLTTRALVNGVVTTDLTIGFENAAGSLTLGGAVASLSAGQGALMLRHESDATGAVTRKVALQTDGQLAVQAPGLNLDAALRLSYNRWGEALEALVATPSGDFAVQLLADETRLSGQAQLSLADTLQVNGQLSIESRLGQTVTLSNGAQALVNQLVIGGAGVSATVRSGSGDGATHIAELGDIDIAAVVSTEVVGTGARQWITTSASLGTVSVGGYGMQDLQSAQLQINRAYDAATGRLIDAANHASDAARAVIDWSSSAQTLALTASQSIALTQALPRFEIPVSGALDIGGARITGDYTITLEQIGPDRIWTVDATQASVGFRSGGAYVGIDNASGTLTLGPGSVRSGSLSGTAVVEGLAGLSVGGNFTTHFDGNGLQLTGTGLSLDVAGFGQISGDLTVERSPTGQILLSATGVDASFGAGGAGISVTNASLGLYVAGLSESTAGYALVASGSASLQGFAGVSMSADAAVRINTLGQSLSTTVGGVQLEFANRDRLQEVSVTSGSLTVSGLGTLSGALAVTTTTRIENNQTVSDVRIGLSGVSGSLSLGALSADLSMGTGAIVLQKVGTAAGTHAVQLEGNVVLAGAGVNLTATQMRVAYNRLGSAISSLEVRTGQGSYTVNLLNNETRVSGQASATVAGLELSGEVFVEMRTGVSHTLVGGAAVTLDQTVLGGTGLALSYSSGGSTLAQFGGADLALVFSQDTANPSQRWLTALGQLGSIDVMGQSLADLNSAQLRLNQAMDAAGHLIEDPTRAVLDWSGDKSLSIALSAVDAGQQAVLDMADRRWEIPVSGAVDFGAARLAGDFNIVLDRDAATEQRIWRIQASDVDVALAAGGARVALQGGSGNLFLNGSQRSGSISGTAAISGLAGLGLSGQLSASFDADGLSLAGENIAVNVDGFGSLTGNFAVRQQGSGDAASLLIGLDGLQADLGGVSISGGQLGLYAGANALGEAGYALVASGTAGVNGLTGLSLNASASVRINTLGEAVAQTIRVGGQSLAVDFADGLAVQTLQVQQGTLTLDGLGSITGNLGIQAQTVQSGGVTTSTLRMGLSDLHGNLTPGGVGAILQEGMGALYIEKVTSGGVTTSGYALQVGGSLQLTGIDGVTLQADALSIAYNRLGRALENEVIATGSGDVLMTLADNETRIRGHMAVEVAGVLSVSGDMFIETRSDANAATVLLSDGSTVSVNQLIFGGAGVQAALGNSTLGASLRDLDMAVVLSTERNASAPRQWISAQALVGGATVQGYALADLRSAQLLLNSELVAGELVLGGTRPVIDWNGADDSGQTTVAIAPDQNVSFAQGGQVFELAVDGRMAFGPASLSGQFDIALEASAQGERAWRIDANGVDLALQAHGARVGLSNGSGQLWLGKDNTTGLYGASQRSGSISGTASVTGVDDLTLTGTLATRFDSQGNLELAGAVDMAIAGFAQASGQFALTQTALQTAQPQTQAAAQRAGAVLSLSELQRGGQQSASAWALRVAEGSGADMRVREGLYVFGWSGASAQVRLLASDSNAVWTAKLQTAMTALLGNGNVRVSGSVADGFAITLSGTRLGQPVIGLSVQPPADPGLRDDWGSNTLVAQATASTGAVHALDLMPEGTQGSIRLGFDFAAVSNTVLHLNAYDSTTARFREGSYDFSFGGQSVKVSSQSVSGTPLSDAEFSWRLRQGLDSLLGQASTLVGGSRSAGFTLEFVGNWAGQAVAVDSAAGGSGLFMRAPSDAAASVAVQDSSQVISQAISASVGTAYSFNVRLPAGGVTVNSDSFALQFADNPRSANIKFVNLQDSQGRHIIDALKVLTGSTANYTTKLLVASADGQTQKIYQSSDITVRQLRSPSNDQLYEISFTGSLANKVLGWGALSVSNTGATTGIAYNLTAKEGSTASATGAVHTLARFDPALRGTFTLHVEVAGTTYTTGPIAMQASGAALEAALLMARAPSNATLASTGVMVTGSINSQGHWQVQFGGSALGQSIAPMSRSISVQAAPAALLTVQASGLSTAAGHYTTAAIDFSQFNDTSSTGAAALRDALLAARTADGRSFDAAGVTVSSAYDEAARQWRVTLGGTAVGQRFAPFQGEVTPRSAPAISLTQTATGASTNEVQRLQMQQAGALQLGFNGRYTAVMESANLTADALQSSLEALDTIGSGNVRVSAVADGAWEVTFQGALAGRNVNAVQLQSVQTLDVTLANDAWADALRVGLAGQADTGRSIERLSGTTDAQWQARLVSELQQALQSLPGVGRGNLVLQPVAGSSGQFYLVASGGLQGKALPALEVQLFQPVSEPDNYLHVGVSGATVLVGNGTAGLQIEQAEMGLVISRSTPSQVGVTAAAPGFALYASGQARLAGFDGQVSLQADAVVQINTLGRAVDQTVKTGLTTPERNVRFDDALARQEITIEQGAVQLAGLAQLSGALKIVSTTATTTTVDGQTQTITDMRIGVDEANGALSAGSASLSLSGATGAVVLRHTTTGTGDSATVAQQFALMAEGNVAVTGVPGLGVQADSLLVAVNRWGSDLVQDVATARGNYRLDLVDNETRARGQMRIDVAGALQASGQLFIESRMDQSVLLSDGSQVRVDQLMIGGADLNARFGNASVGATLSDTDLAIVLSTELVPNDQTARRWITTQADVGAAALAAGVRADIDQATLQINRQMASTGLLAPGGVVIDWNGADDQQSTVLTLAPGRDLVLADGGQVFVLDVTGDLWFGPAQLGGSFALVLNEDSAGAQSWTLTARDAHASVSAGSASVSLSNGSGQILIAADGTKSGSVSGVAAVSGVDGLSLQGTLASRFDGAGNFQLAGDVQLGVAGFANLSGEFAVTQQIAPLVVPQLVISRAQTQAVGSVNETLNGGQQSPTRLRLIAAGTGLDGQALFREGVYVFSHQGSSQSIDSTGLNDAQWAGALRAGLNLLLGAEAVSVSGSRSAGYEIALTGVGLNGRPVTGLVMTPPADASYKEDWGSISVTALATTASVARHALLLTPVGSSISGAKFKLTLQRPESSQSTVEIRYIADINRQASAIQEALEALVGRGKVTVQFDKATGGVSAQGYRISFAQGVAVNGLTALAFTTASNGQLIPGEVRVTARTTALSGGAAASGTTQVIDLHDASIQGRFTLSFTDNGITYATDEIAFDASESGLRQALLAATGNGASFASRGGDAQVSFMGTPGNQQWQVQFAGAAAGRHIAAMVGEITQIQRAPQAQLSLLANGNTTSELQRVSAPAAGYFALAYQNQSTAPLPATVSAAQLQLALENLAGLGRGNVQVTAAAGGWDVAFGGQLVGRDIEALRFSQVQVLDLRMPDGLADSVQLRLSGQSTWAQTLDLRDKLPGEIRVLLQASLSALPQIGAGNLQVFAGEQAGVYRLVAAGDLAGQNLPAVVAGLSREVEQAPDYLLIGASGVNGIIGGPTAGVQLSGAQLGLVISRPADSAVSSGYALSAAGAVTLQGLGDAVTLNASGSVAINTLGRTLDMLVPAGLGSTTVDVRFDDPRHLQQLMVNQGSLQVQGLGTLSGALAVTALYHKVDGIDTTDVRIGLNNVQGQLNAGGLQATLANGGGAVLLRDQVGIGTVYAVQAEGDLSFAAGDAVTLSADRLQLTLNRWGSDVEETVRSADGLYQVSLVDGESRIRGRMGIEVANVLTAQGDLFLETQSNQTERLSDGTSVVVDRLIIGGTGLGLNLSAGGSLGATLADVQLLAVLATERAGQGRRWLGAQASVGEATVAGYALGSITEASLQLNRALASTSGAAAAADAPVVNWSGADLSRQIRSGLELEVVHADRMLDIQADATLRLGESELSGQFMLSLEASVTGDRWKVGVEDASLGMRLGGVGLNLSDVQGSLYLLSDGGRQGSVTGQAALVGVPGLSLEGELLASFDASGRLQIAGTAALDVLGMASLEGDFLIDRTVLGQHSQIRLAINHLSTEFSVPGGVGSAGLQDGRLLVLLGSDADGQPGYAMQGMATAVIDTPLVDLTGQVQVRGNTLGRAVTMTQMVGGSSLVLALDAARQSAVVDFGQLDALLTDLLGDGMALVAGIMSDLKAQISPEFERDGNGNPLGTENINDHPMAAELPLIGTSLTELMAADRILALGDFTQRYLGTTAGALGNLPEPTYGPANQPTLRGLLVYLQTHWLPSIGASADALQVVMGDQGLSLRFDDVLKFSTATELVLGAQAEQLGLAIDGTIDFEISVEVDAAFELALNWGGANSGANFNLERFKVAARASANDIDVTATLGPLAASLGDAQRQTGRLLLEIGGEMQKSASGALGFAKTVDKVEVVLPVYAQLGSLDLAAGKTPTIRISGSPFGGQVSWSTENFDAIGDFSRLSVVDLVLMFPDFIDALAAVAQDDRIAQALPFLDASLDQLLLFGEGFKTSVYDKIDFYKPRVDVMSLPSVTVSQIVVDGAVVNALVNPLGGFDAEFLNKKEITLWREVAGMVEPLGTYAIERVIDGKTLALAGAQISGAGLRAVVHEERVLITTLQEFISAVNQSGVLPAGLQIVFDPVHRSLGVPLRFR